MRDLDNEELEATRNMQSSAESAEKTADEMFEELGYEKENNPGIEILYKKDENHIIRFWKNNKSIIKQNEDGRYMSISMQELQAINKKVKELGWNE